MRLKMEKISEFTVRRLSNYFRILLELEKSGTPTVSSQRLAELGGITSAQVRKDLSYFGNFGTRGLGYSVSELKAAIMEILGLNHQWTMALFGAGSLGQALFYHQGFRDDGFFFRHVFDIDDKRVGGKWLDVEISHQRHAEEVLRRDPVAIAVIATPPAAAQDIADILVRAGTRGILNFAPTQLAVPEDVSLRNVNLAVALESLSFFLSQE
ncbi:MAG: redox-sensing transcriptional repressor Rex [Candidatus Krumholzibacteria bacterium]|nr:redox-sensing transcriptional repressor Rex [Candidatus Krumholzibacteria bacterium]MDH4336797.1 redox-sensing transcriptional repressor Rex [Candidatus Krumholzibacteria bacterium]MDH5269436.1 redox-sensing transcriptional repressor Rex [Candidatus Krumholzibacteria bacterium]